MCRAIVVGACLLSLTSGAEAAESIRVLLSADVPRLDIRARQSAVGDGCKRPWSGPARAGPSRSRWKGFLLNGARMQTEQLTLHGGEQGLTLTFPRPARKPNGAASHRATPAQRSL